MDLFLKCYTGLVVIKLDYIEGGFHEKYFQTYWDYRSGGINWIFK
jgi:hypothetical protein